jgi:hypothetical protein
MPIDKSLIRDGIRALNNSFSVNVAEAEREDYRRQFVVLAEREGRIVGPAFVRYVAFNSAVGTDFYNKLVQVQQLPVCRICGNGRGLPIKRDAEFTANGTKVAVREEISVCTACKGEFYTPEQSQKLQDMVAMRAGVAKA